MEINEPMVLTASDIENICPKCGYEGLHGRGSIVMFPNDDMDELFIMNPGLDNSRLLLDTPDLWNLYLYCDKCDVEIEQQYEVRIIKSIVYKEKTDGRKKLHQ